ncbi:MAG: dihydrodipicolinate synthase family protein [Haloferacaceae archaeon]
MTADVTGLLSPVMIPFDEAGAVDLDRVPDSTAFTIDCGADAVVAAGTAVAQELTSLTVPEREALITETVAAADGEVPVFAGVSHPALPVVDDLTDHALAAGADGLFLMPPWGIQPSRETTMAYYEHVTERTDVPVVLYNNPTTTFDLPKEWMADIMALEGVAYAKESSRNWRKLAWLLDEVHEPGEKHVLTTLDVLYQTLQMGGVGATMPPPVTAPAREIIDAYEAGDTERALAVQRHLSKFPPGGARLNAACKAAMEIAGCDVGGIRPPYPDVTDEVYAQIEDWMEDVEVAGWTD